MFVFFNKCFVLWLLLIKEIKILFFFSQFFATYFENYGINLSSRRVVFFVRSIYAKSFDSICKNTTWGNDKNFSRNRNCFESLFSKIFEISLTFVRNTNVSHGGVGRTTRFSGARNGFDSQNLLKLFHSNITISNYELCFFSTLSAVFCRCFFYKNIPIFAGVLHFLWSLSIFQLPKPQRIPFISP